MTTGDSRFEQGIVRAIAADSNTVLAVWRANAHELAGKPEEE